MRFLKKILKNANNLIVLRNIKITKKILISFCLINLCLIVFGFFLITAMQKGQSKAIDLKDQIMSSLDNMKKPTEKIYKATSDQNSLNEIANHLYVNVKKEQKILTELQNAEDSEQLYNLTSLLQENKRDSLDSLKQVREIIDNNKRILDETSGSFGKISNDISDSLEGISEITKLMEAQKRQSIFWIMFVLFVSVIVSILVIQAIKPIKKLLLHAKSIGEGDLSQRMNIQGSDEIGQLSATFHQMQGSIQNVIRKIKDSIEMLDTSTVELSSSSRQQADGSMQQSTALQEISTTIEELSATSKQISDTAQKVAELAAQSLEGMEMIKTNTDQEANRILVLGEKSQVIGEVVSIIDDIAKQTNILALNASIEAARAGEAGKGFDVVAIEIRELATNVAKSTKQIREIIKEIQDATNASIMATENVGRSVQEGIAITKQTADSAKQITTATHQQGSATEQVVSAIKQMNDISGQTTAGANQISDTAHQLVELMSDQRKLVEQFKLE